MFKTVAFAGLLAASCAASAATSTWTFAYTGFFDERAGAFSSDYRLSGSFSGSDDNGDGILEKSEISALFVNGMNYIACEGDSNDYYKCGTDSFRYALGGNLEFVAGQHGSDPFGTVGGAHYFRTGDREWEYNYSPESMSEYNYLWTAETRFMISKGITSGSEIPAIPEPGTWAMLGTGLLLISAAGLRRRREDAAQLHA